MADLTINLPPEALAPIIAQTVAATLAAVEAERARFGKRLAYSEGEAAELLDLEQHQLRDKRLSGRIKCSQIVGRRIRYSQADLLEYLAARRFEVGKPFEPRAGRQGRGSR